MKNLYDNLNYQLSSLDNSKSKNKINYKKHPQDIITIIPQQSLGLSYFKLCSYPMLEFAKNI